MRIYDIVIFIFIFNMSLSMVSQIGLVGDKVIIENICAERDDSGLCIRTEKVATYVNEKSGNAQNVVEDVTGSDVDSTQEQSFVNAVYAFIFMGIPMIVGMLFESTILVYPMLLNVGFPKVLALPISTIVYVIYIFGVIQLIADRSMKSYE